MTNADPLFRHWRRRWSLSLKGQRPNPNCQRIWLDEISRYEVECAWVLFSANLQASKEFQPLSAADAAFVQAIADDFDSTDAARIKSLEAITNHDVKAVEYFLKEAFAERQTLQARQRMDSFGCTSEDINNTAYGLMIKNAKEAVLPKMQTLIGTLEQLATDMPIYPCSLAPTVKPRHQRPLVKRSRMSQCA